MERLKKSIRLKHWVKENGIEGDEDYIPSLYVPSRWNPPEASSEAEKGINQFTLKLTNAVAQTKSHPKSNLTRLQYNCLQSIKNDHCFIICMSDKNLGPVIMECATYLEKCLTEHLLCTDTYLQLTKEDATERALHTRRILNQIRLKHRTDLSDAENLYFQRAAKLEYRLPQFYLTIKVHKKPIKTRPIVSCVNSYLNVFSKWLDYRFKQLIKYSPTYLKDSFQVLQELKALGPLPPQAKLFTCDAVSMYTNINSMHGLQTIANWIEEYNEEVPQDFPTELFLRVLEIVMTHNIFQLDDTYWLQTCGT